MIHMFGERSVYKAPLCNMRQQRSMPRSHGHRPSVPGRPPFTALHGLHRSRLGRLRVHLRRGDAQEPQAGPSEQELGEKSLSRACWQRASKRFDPATPVWPSRSSWKLAPLSGRRCTIYKSSLTQYNLVFCILKSCFCMTTTCSKMRSLTCRTNEHNFLSLLRLSS